MRLQPTESQMLTFLVFPMLPLKLSNNFTSLNLGQDRLALVCEMHIATDGSINKSFIYRAWVHNRAQLAYDNVSDWLEGKAEDEVALLDRHQAVGCSRGNQGLVLPGVTLGKEVTTGIKMLGKAGQKAAVER